MDHNLLEPSGMPRRIARRCPDAVLAPCTATCKQSRNVNRFRGGLVCKAHRLFVSLNSMLESNQEEEESAALPPVNIEFFIVNLLVRIHFIIVMIRWTGLAPWEFYFPFPEAHREAVPGRGARPLHRHLQTRIVSQH